MDSKFVPLVINPVFNFSPFYWGQVNLILVEQDITEASEYTNNIYLVEDGRIVFEGKGMQLSINHMLKKYSWEYDSICV